MNEVERIKLRPQVVAWSDGCGYDLATALAGEYTYLLPKRITNAQLSGLNSIVMAASHLGQVTAFAQNQATRAERAARLDMKGYWEALKKALEALEGEATRLASLAGMTPLPAREKARAKPPDWLVLWMAQEFVQHLVAHSLYLGGSSKGKDKEKYSK